MITNLIDRLRGVWRSLVLRLNHLSLSDTGADVDRLVAAVRKSELFCNADPGLLRGMLEGMTVQRVAQGDVIMRQGSLDDCFFVLAAGRAQVTRSRDGESTARQLAVLTEPAGLGEEALLGAEMRSVTVTMLSEGYVLKIRRGDFMRLVERGVKWLLAEAAEALPQPPAAWLWSGEASTRPRGMAPDVLTITPDRLRLWLSELDVSRQYLCCGRDDSNSALTAFLLMQRGFKAYAVRDGRRVVAGSR